MARNKRIDKIFRTRRYSETNYLKAYFVYGKAIAYHKESRQKELEQIGKAMNIKNTALTFVPSFTDTATEANLNNINPNVENTFIIYKHRTIIDKFVDLKPSKENFSLISETLEKTNNEYFNLPEPSHDRGKGGTSPLIKHGFFTIIFSQLICTF